MDAQAVPDDPSELKEERRSREEAWRERGQEWRERGEAFFASYPRVSSRMGPERAAGWWPQDPAAQAAASIAVGSGASLAALGMQSMLRPTLLGQLYTRIERSRALSHPHRERLYRSIAASPGITFTDLRRNLGAANGVLVHHLTLLERHHLIVSRKEGNSRRFYVLGEKLPPPSPALTAAQRRFLDFVRGAGHATRSTASAALAITPQAAGHHIQRLSSMGFLAVSKTGREKVCRTATQHDAHTV